MIKVINPNEVRDIINSCPSFIFSAEFVKKDKTLRKMVCRLGVKKGLVNPVSTSSKPRKPLADNYMRVYDMQISGYRIINLDTLFKLKVNGINYSINQPKTTTK